MNNNQLQETLYLGEKTKKQTSVIKQEIPKVLFWIHQFAIIIIAIIAQVGKTYLISILIGIVNIVFIFILIFAIRNKLDNLITLCFFLSKVSVLILIPFSHKDFRAIIIISITIIQYQTNNKLIVNVESISIKIVALIIILFSFDILWIISLSYNLLNEIVNIIRQKEDKILSNCELVKNLISSQKIQDNLWKTRIQMIPASFFMINQKSSQISFKNNNAIEYFSLFCDSDSEINNLVLNHLEFTLIQDSLDLAQQSSSYLKIKQRLRETKFKSESVRANSYGQYNTLNSPKQECKMINSKNNESSKLYESNAFNSKFNLEDILQSLRQGELNEYIKNNTIELLCIQNVGGKKFQLSGQLLVNSQDGEIFLLLNDISKQYELQQYISRDEFKSKIIESFSHELRTPLNSALNFLTNADMDPEIKDSIKENIIQPTISSLKIQSHLISDIVDFSQHYAHNLSLLIQPFSLNDLINEILSIFTLQFQMKGIELTIDLFDCAENIQIIQSDCGRIMQILLNLISNSLKFSSGGFVVVKISSYTQEILKFSVIDIGQGISTEKLEQIKLMLANINAFKHMHMERDWQGLGLLISAILVNKLGPQELNTIKIESLGINNGTKVTFYIKNHNQQEQKNQHKKTTIRQSSFQQQQTTFFNGCPSAKQINGNIISANELQKFNTKHLDSWQQQRSNENTSLIPDSIIFESVEQKINLLNSINPSFLTEIQNNYKQDYFIGGCSESQLDVQKNQSSQQQQKILSIKQIKQVEEYESEDYIQTYKRKKKCQCQRILSVDDEIFNQKSLQILLSQLGFEVILAYNGKEAITKIQQIKQCGKKKKNVFY